MSLHIRANADGFGAEVTGIDLSQPLCGTIVRHIRQAWLEHQVIFFPNQPLDHAQLERFTEYFGSYGKDEFVAGIEGHAHILEVRREPNEPVIPFGSSWHSDWSFQAAPPSATILHAKVIPPIGGDTHYADGIRAYEALPAQMKQAVAGKFAIHSARRPYSHEGFTRSGGDQRSMKILPSDRAWRIQLHPIVRTHPETGKKALWVNPVYTIGVAKMVDREAEDLLARLFAHALQAEFIYQHRWSENMLTMWDNRSVLHCAQGGYDGHRRVMHRTIVKGTAPH